MASRATSTANLLNAATGAGVLGMPYAFRVVGVGAGAAATLGVAALSVATLQALVAGAAHHRAVSYQDLVRKAFGARFSQGIAAALAVYCFGSCAAYLIIVADTLCPILRQWLAPGSFLASRAAVISAATWGICTPLSLLRKLEALGAASAASVAILMYIAVAILAHGVKKFAENGVTPGTEVLVMNADSILAVPILIFAFQCHIQVIPIFDELRDPSDGVEQRRHEGVRRRRRAGVGAPLLRGGGAEDDGDKDAEDDGDEEVEPVADEAGLGDKKAPPAPVSAAKVRDMQSAIQAAVATCAIGYGLVGVFCYLYFAQRTDADALKCAWPDGDISIVLARIGMSFIAIISYPINLSPARVAVDDLLTEALGWPAAPPNQAPAARHFSQTLLFVAGTWAIALAVDNLGKVYSIIGATMGVTVSLVVPALLLRPRRPIAAGALLVLSAFNMVATLLVTFFVPPPAMPPPAPPVGT